MMRRVSLVVTMWTGLVVTGAAQERAPGAGLAVSDHRAVVDQYCVTCHNERTEAGGLTLQGLDFDRVEETGPIWEKVVRKLRTASMPPQGVRRPDEATYEALASWVETNLDAAAARHPNPGRPSIHRLNRAEYANAIRDLLAVDVDAAALLPPDDSSDGFDNNADILGVSPALLERYLSAAAKISAAAVGSPSIDAGSETFRVRGDASQTGHIEGLPLGTRGGLRIDHLFPLDGEYVIQVNLLQTNLGSVRGLEYRNEFELSIDGERVLLAPVGGPEDYTAAPLNATDVVEAINARLQARVTVQAGPRVVVATFLDKTSAQMGNRLQAFERSTLIATDHFGLPHIESVTILGPFGGSQPRDTPSRQRIFVCDPGDAAGAAERDACAERIVTRLARRAYRRPVTASDVDPLLAFYARGSREGGFDAGIELALRAMLASPKFVFRAERDPAGAAPGTTYAISDLELASRLSFFLWSSIPDDELLAVAAEGRLGAPDVLDTQVRRMLADPRADALVTNFAGQWLQLRNLRTAEPDKNLFPDFDDNLRQALGREAELFFGSIIREDRRVVDLLTGDYTFVNERLARHYGMPNVYGSHFRRVALGPDEDARRGLLGKGGILLVTSHANRTSPVVRGKWILDNLLGSPPPPPPPNVPPLDEEASTRELTMRERMELHRQNPVCASCHKIMDPLGLALENFDAVGGWRDSEGGAAIDATGQLTDGSEVDGAATLRQALVKRSDVFVSTLTEKLLTYALGRGLEYYDMPAVRGIVREAAAGEYRFSSLVRGIVRSVPFRERAVRAGGADGTLARAGR